MSNASANAYRGHLAMLLFSLLVAGSFALGSVVANEIAPTALNAARFLIAGLVVGAAALATGGIPKTAFAAPWRYLVLGALLATYFVLMFEGLKTSTAISTSAVFTLTPVLSAVAGYVLLRQIITRWMAVALTVGASGALWVIFRADLSALITFEVGRGEMIFFVGCIAHAIYTPMVRKLSRGERPLVFTFGTIFAALIVLVVWGWSDIIATGWLAMPPIVWLVILYVGILASSGTFLLIHYATHRLPSSKVMAYTYLTPSWVIIWQFLMGSGAPPLVILGGVVLTILALLMLLRSA